EEYINKLPLVERPEATVYKWTHPLLTITPVTNKKEKSSKKEKINNKSFKVKKVNLFQARSVYHLSSIIYHPNEIFF
nr:hypothetical protein [Bacteroidia bacterium]